MRRHSIGVFWETAFLDATSPADFWRKWNPYCRSYYLEVLRRVRRSTHSPTAVACAMYLVFLFVGFSHDIVFTKVMMRQNGWPYMVFFTFQFQAVMMENILKLRMPFIPKSVKKLLTFIWIGGTLSISHLLSKLLLAL